MASYALFALLFCLADALLQQGHANAGGWASPLTDIALIDKNVLDSLGKSAQEDAQKEFLAKVPKRPQDELTLRNGGPTNIAGEINHCKTCAAKNYVESCPLGWAELDEDGFCIAPVEYSGICNNRQIFLGASFAEKNEAEEACGVCWPCSANSDSEALDKDCVRSWGLPCPVGFSVASSIDDTNASDATCVPDLYQGPCSEPEVAFSSLEDKKSFAIRCNSAWPCSVQCEKTGLASSLCPEGWAHTGEDVCVAPQHSKIQGCPLKQNVHGWTPKLREEFATKCGIRFLCTESNAIRGKEQTLSDLEVASGTNDKAIHGVSRQS